MPPHIHLSPEHLSNDRRLTTNDRYQWPVSIIGICSISLWHYIRDMPWKGYHGTAALRTGTSRPFVIYAPGYFGDPRFSCGEKLRWDLISSSAPIANDPPGFILAPSSYIIQGSGIYHLFCRLCTAQPLSSINGKSPVSRAKIGNPGHINKCTNHV